MPVRLYIDHNVNQAVIHGLRLRGLDVLTAFEDGAHQLPDPDLLDRATALGVVFVPQALAVGLCVEQLQLLAGAGEAQEFVGSLEFSPLR